jgi:hypothetical protein
MPTANELNPSAKSNADYRRIEQTVNLTVVNVVSVDDGNSRCLSCATAGTLFHCHLFRQDGRPIVTLCKECAIGAAGGEEHVWLKTLSKGLDKTWEGQRRKRPARA